MTHDEAREARRRALAAEVWRLWLRDRWTINAITVRYELPAKATYRLLWEADGEGSADE